MVYDRVLADIVAGALPLGGYAEPAQKLDAGSAVGAAARAVRFARDGWSVARALSAGLAPRERGRRIQEIIDELAVPPAPPPVTILAEAADGIEERLEVRFDDLPTIVASYPRDTRLTIVIDANASSAAVRLRAVGANGLAG